MFNNVIPEPFLAGFGGGDQFFGGFGIPNNQNRQNQRPNFFGNMGFPFFSSPFSSNNMFRQNVVQNDIFDPVFEMFGTTFNNAFQDNFSSNFRSNFHNNHDNIFNTIIEESLRNAQEQKKPPASKKAIEKLKKFKMNEKYCKKNDKGELEQPSCSVCLDEIKMDGETLLIPCGHMYHSECILNWLSQNNTCPVCRFELPPQK